MDARRTPRRSHTRPAVAGLALVAALAGCGGGGGDDEAPVPTGSPGTSPTATPAPVATSTPTLAPTPETSPAPLPPVALEEVVGDLASPLDLQQPDDGSNRLFVVEQAGRIRVVADGALLDPPFLDIRDRVASGGETGLLGLAFHPAYAANGRFFVNYTRTAGGQLQSVIAELRADPAGANVADPSETVLLTVDQPFANHNGGQLHFGPDGFLYVALGDGGGGGDPLGNAQRLDTLLGKLLRIDVDGAAPYAIPPDNPFAETTARGEIWAYGLRNPWRFSFDRATGRLFCGDVGQSTREEVDLIVPGGNYGWSVLEGALCFPPPAAECDPTGFVAPIDEYGNDQGRTVIGGYVYRGARIAGLDGAYVFGDFVSGRVFALREAGGGWRRDELLDTDRLISAFGQDRAGEIYVVDIGGGAVLALRPAP
jgi:glucose/arabinose dehydrogenase